MPASFRTPGPAEKTDDVSSTTAYSSAPTVLVVDDDPLVRLMTHEALAGAGMDVLEADCGESALDLLADRSPDIVLLDVMMPGKDGFQTCTELRGMAATTHTPVLMMTGLDDVESISRAYDVGATDFFTKPINYLMLVHRVRYMLRAERTANRLRDSQASLADAQRIARLASWRWDEQSDRWDWSPLLPELVGVEPDPADLPATLLARMPADDRPGFAGRLFSVLTGTSDKPLELHVDDGDGGRVLLLASEARRAGDGVGRYVLGTMQDITERRRQEQRILELVYYDELTGLPNRNYVQRQLGHVIEQSARAERPFALLSIWLDQFRRINNTLGENAGNSLLREAAQRFTSCLRASDMVALSDAGSAGADTETVARIDNDEFLVLLPEIRRPEDASVIAQRVIASMAQPFRVGESDIFLSNSIGIITTHGRDADPALLLKNADAAMHQARELGRNRYCFFDDEIHRRAAARISMETRLRHAVERGELLLHYQPLVDLRSRLPIGAEALVRWQDPEHGLIPPDRFIGLAEETGLILPIGEWVLRTACHQLQAWHESGLCDLKVSVNLSAVQFHSGKLTAQVSKALSDSGLRPESLQFEVTESVLVENTDASASLLRALRELGVTLAVDDFGTGYSSMSYLKHFPIDTLKIDRSFVTGLPGKHADVAIARAIVALGHSLGLKVTAEGVETEDQLEALALLQCDLVQGYLFSRPLPAEDFALWLRGVPARAVASA